MFHEEKRLLDMIPLAFVVGAVITLRIISSLPEDVAVNVAKIFDALRENYSRYKDKEATK